MKALIIMAILATFGLSFFFYSRDKNVKKLLLTLVTFSLLLYIVWVGFRVSIAILPLKILNIVLGFFAWGGVLYYLLRERYIWWLIFAPVIVPVAFVIFSLIGGSRYEDIWPMLF